MSQFTFIHADDWSGLYVDGILITEGHSISPEDALKAALNFGPVDLIDRAFADNAWLEDRGYLPTKLEDVKLEDF